MPRKTDGQKVDELIEKVAQIGATLEERSTQSARDNERARADLTAAREEVRRLQDRIAALEARCAATEERCKALEKLSDRGWQGWLALFGAALALIVALLKK